MTAFDIEPADIVKILLALLVGGALGGEREYRDKAAGFRTLVLICVGATLFTMFSIDVGENNDPSRIAAGVVSGVGFLGAGVIMRDGGVVTGLTTAATIWLTAALGMGIGAGYYGVSLAAAAIILLVLWMFPLIEMRIDALREARTYRLVYPLDEQRPEQVERMLSECGLGSFHMRLGKRVGELHVSVVVTGNRASHDALVKRLLADTELRELSY